MGQGMLIGMAIAAILVIGFVVYIEEKGYATRTTTSTAACVTVPVGSLTCVNPCI